MKVDALEGLPLNVKRKVLHAIAEAAAHGVTLQIATGDPVRRSEAARLAGQASARARLLRFGSANPRTNRERKREPNVNDLGTDRSQNRERIVNGAFTENAISPASLARASEISDLSSEISEIRENQRESACVRPREASLFSNEKLGAKAPEPKKLKTKEPRQKALAWRRVPADWNPNDQHRTIAAECCVPFELELAKFRDHEFSAPKRDPDATFRNWLRSARSARPTPYSVAPLPPAPGKIRMSSPAEIYRALGREA